MAARFSCNMQKLTLLALALIGPAISGCSSTQSVTDRFLAATGATWRVAGAPMVFERTEARFSRSARDYTYIGPVALNRRGTYDYFLWVGIASTLDRGFLAPEEPPPEELQLYIDGEPLDLSLVDWDRRVPELAGQVAYVPPVAVRTARPSHNGAQDGSPSGLSSRANKRSSSCAN